MPDSAAGSPSTDPDTPPASWSSSSPDALRKRTRASKPKVRTGCITCKIRRVKCDEEKPYCKRCTSTGRTCDGYDKATPSRNRSQESMRGAELAKLEFLKEYQGLESVRSMRPIMPDIDGTELERKFFHRFRLASIDGVTGQSCGFLWRGFSGGPGSGGSRQTSPGVVQPDSAVKHAVIALAAAYQFFQQPEEPLPEEFASAEAFELFIIQQYNLSIAQLQLQRHEEEEQNQESGSAPSLRITLLCCYAFVCLETLRGNHAAAVTHLTNGLRIIESFPPKRFRFLGETPYEHEKASMDEMQDVIRGFGRLETSLCFFAADIRPVVSEFGYRFHRLDDGSSEEPFQDLWDVRGAYRAFLSDVVGRLWVASRMGEEVLCADPARHREQACFRKRAARLEELGQEFLAGSKGPQPDTEGFFDFHVELLRLRRAQILLDGMEGGGLPNNPYAQKADAEEAASLSMFQELHIDSMEMSCPGIEDDRYRRKISQAAISDDMFQELLRIARVLQSSTSGKVLLPPDWLMPGMNADLWGWFLDFERSHLFRIRPKK